MLLCSYAIHQSHTGGPTMDKIVKLKVSPMIYIKPISKEFYKQLDNYKHRLNQNFLPHLTKVYTGCALFVWRLWRSRRLNYLGFYSCVGQAITLSLRPCLNPSNTWLLIYGREKAKLVVASKTALLLFSSNAKIK